MAYKWNFIFSKKRKRFRNRKLYFANVWQYLLKWARPICKTKITHKILCEVSLDDSIIIVETKEEAKNALKEITNFLDKSLELKLNKKTQIFKGKQGVNFCGYKINEYRMKLRDKGKRKLKKKVKKLTNQVYDGKISSKEAKKYLAGHMGYIKYADTYNLVNKLFYIENN